jgi:hypothetical protein
MPEFTSALTWLKAVAGSLASVLACTRCPAAERTADTFSGAAVPPTPTNSRRFRNISRMNRFGT